MVLTPGTRLGPYEILAALGAGGMGEVYRATDTNLKRQVAIKVLPASLAGDADRLARFQREAEVLAALNHPNIAAIYGLERTPDCTALVMELVEGEDLSQRIARGAIPIDETLPMAKQIADALEAAHEQGIIHRDLKPANIKVRADGTVKVLDFGLAKMMEPAVSSPDVTQALTITSPAMTRTGIILGTAAYMSPEQARGKSADKRSDVWAFGCVLYEMLTGTRAFDGESMSDTLAAVLRGEPAWADVPADVPPSIRALLRGCLDKDRQQRLAGMSVVQFLLSEKARLTSTAGQDTAITRPVRRPLVATWALAGLAVVVALVTSVLYLGEARDAGTMVRFGVLPPTGATRVTGVRGTFAVSPDGQMLVFEGRSGDGTPVLFIRRLDADEPMPLAGTNNATGPFWSPDSRSIGFFNDGVLYRMALDGSPPRRLCDVRGTFLGGTWGARDVIVFASSGVGLSRVQATVVAGTTPVTTLDATAQEASHASPQFLPDGRHVLFVVRAGASSGVIWIASIDDSQRTRLTESNGGASYANGWLLYTTGTNPRELVARRFDVAHLALTGDPQSLRDRLSGGTVIGQPGFSVSSTGGVLVVDRRPPIVQQLTWVDRSGRPLSTVGSPRAIPDFALEPDGRRIVATLVDATSLKPDFWLFDGRRVDGTRLTRQGDTDRPMFARDGQHIFFDRWAPNRGLHVLLIDGTTAENFENPGAFTHFEDVTRDGRYFVMAGRFPASGVSIQRVGDPHERRVLIQDDFDNVQPRVSSDGRWLAFTRRTPQTGEVFVQPFDRPGGPIQVSLRDGIGPIWRDDGPELYYESAEGMMAVLISETGGTLSAGDPRKLFPLRTQGLVTNFPHNVEVTDHGQKFLVNAVVGDTNNAPLEVTVNWTTALTK